MFGEGKKKDLIIKLLDRVVTEYSAFGTPSTRERDYDIIEVWCEHGYESKLEKINGVFKVMEDSPEPRYYVYVDPRFDSGWVMREVEGVVLTEKPTKRKKTTEHNYFFTVESMFGTPKKKGKKK